MAAARTTAGAGTAVRGPPLERCRMGTILWPAAGARSDFRDSGGTFTFAGFPGGRMPAAGEN
ncbi:hypothetical protein Sru01_23290 [Sphaerisporangium rufum]|uniref:Uncharacterized protein n=1 Tax=Sphaerisporangium rufum TaxID=1381558 RepID=A0A919R596_9ACTN|nr:hypothetical protein Sru01_23290 [Sphaerisporangium rufum]